jgi:hypothetical protein
MDGDTLFEGTAYMKLFTTQDEQYNNWEFCGLIRDTYEGQVFYGLLSFGMTKSGQIIKTSASGLEGYNQGNLTATIHGNSMERLWYDDNNSLKGESRNEKYHKKYHPCSSSGGFGRPAAGRMPAK